ncbi:MAG: protein kinase, partial [Opitutales bacterium]|nr:protein kinase [Opitutales bacterium]
MDLPEINGYKILEKIGEGSYGNVYKAQHLPSGRAVAVKVVKPAGEGGKDRERRALEFYVRMRESSKKGIVQIIDSGRTSSGLLYYAMSLGECTLHELANQKLKQKTWFTLPEIKKILSELFDGLQSLENEGLVHRDIKPTNIIFIGGKACLSDLGLLEIEDGGDVRYGTENFCAPEYFKGNPDHWSLACIIFFLLSSEYPDKWSSHNSWVSPLGVQKMSRSDIAEYERLRNVILNRATAYRAIDTFRNVQEFRCAILEPEKPRKTKILAAAFAAAAIFAMAAAFYFAKGHGGSSEASATGQGGSTQGGVNDSGSDIFARRDAIFGATPFAETSNNPKEKSDINIEIKSTVAGAQKPAKMSAEPKASAARKASDKSAVPAAEKVCEIDGKLLEQIKQSGYFDKESGVKILSFKDWEEACRGVGEEAQKLLNQKNLLCFGIDADVMKDAQKLKSV